QVVVDGLIVGFIFALVAVGLTLIYGVMDIVNFAHGEFMMLSMYLTFFLWKYYGLDPLFSLPITVPALFLVGVLTYRLLIRHVLDAALIAQIFITFGLLIFLQAAANFLWKADFRNVGDNLLTGIYEVRGLLFNLSEVAAALGALATTFAIFLFINHTETGMALQATAQDRPAARLMGIDTDRMFALAWGIGAASVAVAGSLLATYFSISPLVGATWVLPAYVAVALGGFGSVVGAFYGGLLIGLVEVVGGFFTSPNYKFVFVYLIYLIIVFVRPRGLLGTR
ncbi:MAG: branched-chain amino acid ABC transporter permease, partial [Nitrospinota bacterium]